MSFVVILWDAKIGLTHIPHTVRSPRAQFHKALVVRVGWGEGVPLLLFTSVASSDSSKHELPCCAVYMLFSSLFNHTEPHSQGNMATKLGVSSLGRLGQARRTQVSYQFVKLLLPSCHQGVFWDSCLLAPSPVPWSQLLFFTGPSPTLQFLLSVADVIWGQCPSRWAGPCKYIY